MDIVGDACTQLNLRAEANLGGSGGGGSTVLSCSDGTCDRLRAVKYISHLTLPDPENSELVRAARIEAVTARKRADEMVTCTKPHNVPLQLFFCKDNIFYCVSDKSTIMFSLGHVCEGLVIKGQKWGHYHFLSYL